MAKILVDSLNEKELIKLIPSEEHSRITGSISRLEQILQQCGKPQVEGHIEFLRNLQALRSTGTAHRKGQNYQKVAEKFHLDSKSLRNVFRDILGRGIEFVEFLDLIVSDGSFRPKPPET
jgi:hypothetical protein